jgi:ketosteroid isomerase-like protein
VLVVRVIIGITGLAALTVSLAFAAREQPAATDQDRQAIIALEKAWDEAAPARDIAAYERILADDFIGQWADGTSSNKAETIESLRTSDRYDAVTPGQMNVRFFNGVAVLNGHFSERAVSAGQDLTGKYAFTDVWVKRNGRWQIVAFQSTRYAVAVP